MDIRESVKESSVRLPFTIRENSLLAKLASYKLHAPRMALTLGKTIHLYNCSAEEFMANERWVNHEMEHLRQFRKYGLLKFIFLYLLESIRKGYYNNRFEVEARSAESGEME